MLSRSTPWLALIVLSACGQGSDPNDAGTDAGAAVDGGEDGGAPDAGADDAGADDAGPGDAGFGCAIAEPTVVTFTTDDGLMLEGDLYLSGQPDGASAVLLHMIPPSNDRSNYPRAFIDALVQRCITVLNVDRRGAGGSEGVATDAYLGPNGSLDAKGAIEFLLALPSSPDPLRTAVVGASNGTTTLLDFTVFSQVARIVETPAAVVLLSGGTYTENQNTIADTMLSEVPAFFAYPSSERAWNEALQPGAPAVWSFREFSPGAHGTNLFGANPESIAEVASFVDAQVN